MWSSPLTESPAKKKALKESTGVKEPNSLIQAEKHDIKEREKAKQTVLFMNRAIERMLSIKMDKQLGAVEKE